MVSRYTFFRSTTLEMRTWFAMVVMLFGIQSAVAQRNFGIEGTIKEPGKDPVDITLTDTRITKNPHAFKFRKSRSRTEQEIYPSPGVLIDLQERVRYLGSAVMVDAHDDYTLWFDADSSASLSMDTVFLRQLVEGYFSLYEYSQNNNTRFYYSVDSGDPQLLLYREYIGRSAPGKVHNTKTREHLRQISALIDCDATASTRLKDLLYERDDMVELFEQLNQCQGSPSTTYVEDIKEKLLSVSVGVGVQRVAMSADLEFRDFFGDRRASFDFSGRTTAAFAVDVEFNFPRTNRRLGMAFSPRLTSFSGIDSASTPKINSMTSEEEFVLEVPDLDEVLLPLLIRANVLRRPQYSVALSVGASVNIPLEKPYTIVDLSTDFGFFPDEAFKGDSRIAPVAELRITTFDRFSLSGAYFFPHNSLRSQYIDLSFGQVYLMAQVRI